jgi:hypothetical protein
MLQQLVKKESSYKCNAEFAVLLNLQCIGLGAVSRRWMMDKALPDIYTDKRLEQAQLLKEEQVVSSILVSNFHLLAHGPSCLFVAHLNFKAYRIFLKPEYKKCGVMS